MDTFIIYKHVLIQGEMQQLKSDKNLMETKKELQIEQYKSQINDQKQEYSEDKHKFDLIINQCQNELNSLKRQNQEIVMENKEREIKDKQIINKLENELASKHKEFDNLKCQLRQQIKELKQNMILIETEHESKILIKEKKHEELMEDCQLRMKSVLEKKNAQINRLKRLLEKTVNEYEKEKQNAQSLMNLQKEQLKQLTNELEI